MGPAFGTPAYKAQVETIVTAICGVKDLTTTELSSLLMGYILDRSYSRAAISEAEQEIKRRLGLWQTTRTSNPS